MKKFVLPLVAVFAILAFASVSEACWFPGKRIAQGISARRAAGEGVFQKNGPIKRAARGSV